MGLLGGLFEKKYCSFCGDQIKLLGNRKVEDGNMCKECAGKLSYWFSERRRSTVDELKNQLEYREANKRAVEEFNVSRQLGSDWRLFIDDAKGNFTVFRGKNIKDSNPDIIPLSSVTGVDVIIDDRKEELKKKDKDGNEESYFPPRYRYDYDIDFMININHEFFNELKFSLEDNIYVETIGNQTPDPRNNMKYVSAMEMADAMKAALLRTDVPQAEVKQAMKCPYCGATTVTTANGCCEYCGAAIAK